MSAPSTELITRLTKAISLRRALIDEEYICRIVDDSADDFPDVVIDKLGQLLLAHIRCASEEEGQAIVNELWPAAPWLCAELDVMSFYCRLHLPDSRQSAENAPQKLHGMDFSEAVQSEENMQFFIRPLEAVNAGVFVDTREVRTHLRQQAQGKRVLNLFCYTGLLGLAASCAGASEVVQVDVSKRMLSWAKENWQLNQYEGASPMRFICEDAASFLEKESRRIERGKEGYHIVIIDPPAYGAAGKRGFSLSRDLPILLGGITKVLAPMGELLLMCNLRELSSSRLRDMVSSAVDDSGRAIVQMQELSAPVTDFRCSSAQASSMRGVCAVVR